MNVVGCTEMKMKYEGKLCTFYAYPTFQGKHWYDLAYVQYVDESGSSEENSAVEDNVSSRYYPSLVLGFVRFPGERAPR